MHNSSKEKFIEFGRRLSQPWNQKLEVSNLTAENIDIGFLLNIDQSWRVSNKNLHLLILFHDNILGNNIKILCIGIRDLKFNIISWRIIQHNFLIMEFPNLCQEVIFVLYWGLAGYQCQFVPEFAQFRIHERQESYTGFHFYRQIHQFVTNFTFIYVFVERAGTMKVSSPVRPSP